MRVADVIGFCTVIATSGYWSHHHRRPESIVQQHRDRHRPHALARRKPAARGDTLLGIDILTRLPRLN